MTLEIFWFCLIAVLWGGYFVLEGFDFGVGMLLPFVPRDERDRGTMFDTIGPVWDGNEVWLVVAGGATFAAFPAWYGTMFSGFYLALLLILFLLIVRVLSFEWRDKGDGTGWRWAWLWANAGGSAGIALIWGIGLSNLLYGLPLDSGGDYAGSFWDLRREPGAAADRSKQRTRSRRLFRSDVPVAPLWMERPSCAARRTLQGDRRSPSRALRHRSGSQRDDQCFC